MTGVTDSNDKYGNVIECKNNRLWGDIPQVIVEILGVKLTCLIDTVCSVSVISESIFQSLREKDNEMQILPTAGVMCSGASRRQKQTVKCQVMLSVKVRAGNHEVIFLVVPGLNPEIILGIDMLEIWKAVIDVGHLNMSLNHRDSCGVVKFVTGRRSVIS